MNIRSKEIINKGIKYSTKGKCNTWVGQYFCTYNLICVNYPTFFFDLYVDGNFAT